MTIPRRIQSWRDLQAALPGGSPEGRETRSLAPFMTSRRTPFVSTAKTVSAAAESAIDWPFLEEARPKSGLWERLKSALEEMVFEDDDRPIGMTQLARNTFAPAEANQTSVFFRNAPTFSDYGFIKRYQENPAHGAFQRSAANARSSR